jgi:hypothetical protein
MKIQSLPTSIHSSPAPLHKTEPAGSPASADPTRILLGKLAEKIPGMTVETLSGLDPNEFTPARVAERISGFVASGLAAAKSRGASDERLQQLYDAAVSGVAQGFKEARDILDHLELLQGGIKTQVDETEQKTFAALAEIAPGGRESRARAVLGGAERYRNSEDMSLRLLTREGDEVTIRFSRDQRYAAGFAAGADAQGNAAAWMDVSRSESTRYQFTVQGELDGAEIDALQQMVRDIAGVADEFFNGDVQKAFAQSADIHFDATQLRSMELNLSYSRSLSRAARYEQVDNLARAADEPGRRLGRLMQALAKSAGAPALGFLQSPAQAGRELMTGLVEQDGRFTDLLGPLQEGYRNNLQQLLDAVLPLDTVTAAEAEPEAEG